MNKKELENLYLNKKWSLKAIGEYYSVSHSTIHRLLVKYGIPRKSAVKPKFDIPPRDDLKILYHKDGKSLKEIAEIYGTNRNMISKWFKELGLDITYFKQRPSFEELSNLYEKNRLDVIQLCAIYKVGRKTINKWLDYFGIERRSPQRKYVHLRKVPLTRIQREFIVGTLLGDGYLRNNVLEIKHSVKQINYLLWKKDIMSNYVNYIREHKEIIKSKKYSTFSWHTIRLNELSFFRKLFYKNNKKVIMWDVINFLTPFSMAVWFMDDGWRQKNGMKISSESFTKKEHEMLKTMIKIKFDINVKICEYRRNNKIYNYFSFNKRNSILLSNLIRDYIIEDMEYKILPILND